MFIMLEYLYNHHGGLSVLILRELTDAPSSVQLLPLPQTPPGPGLGTSLRSSEIRPEPKLGSLC